MCSVWHQEPQSSATKDWGLSLRISPAGLLQEPLPLAQEFPTVCLCNHLSRRSPTVPKFYPNSQPLDHLPTDSAGQGQEFHLFIKIKTKVSSSWNHKRKFKVQLIRHTFRAASVVFHDEKDALTFVSSLLWVLKSISPIIQCFCSLIAAPFEGTAPIPSSMSQCYQKQMLFLKG